MREKIDNHIGARIRQRRWMLGLTQQQLGDVVGIKFQQVQKYETGQNRVSASRLYEIAIALDAPVNFFFEGLCDANFVEPDPRSSREAAELTRCFVSLPPATRARLLDLLRTMVEEPQAISQ